MDYKIYIDEGLEIKSKQILNDYWLIQNSNFLYKATEITSMHYITKVELIKLVQKHSYCEIIHGNCQICDEEIREKVTSKTDYISAIKYKTLRCSKCTIEIRNRIAQEEKDGIEKERQNIQLKFDMAVMEKKWLNLPENEITILYNLIENKTKNKIYKNVFGGNNFDKSMWNYVNKFQKLGFINVIRNGYSVVEFEFDSRINDAVRNSFFAKNVANKSSVASISDALSFSLHKKESKETVRQPDYGGTFILQKDVILKADVKYIYGGWVQTDGSINLKITPLSNLESNFITQENINNEHHLIDKVVNNMLNEIQNEMSHFKNFGHDSETFDSDLSEDDDYEVPF